MSSSIQKRINPAKLKQARLARGYSTIELAKLLGVSRQALSQYENGIVSPSPETLQKYMKELDFPLSFFTKTEFTNSTNLGSTFFRSLASSTRKAREMLKVRQEWVNIFVDYIEKFVKLPKVNLPNIEVSEQIDAEYIEELAKNVRKYWGLGLGPISNVLVLFEKNGVIITRASTGSSETDACSQWRNGRPYIFLGMDKNSVSRSRFSAAHELGHLILHRWVDDSDLADPKFLKKIEKEANAFAGAFLLPRESFSLEVMSTSINHFIALKERWKVSIAMMVYRCEELGILSENQVLYLRKQLSSLNYRKKEPLDDVLEQETPMLLRQALELLFKHNIVDPYEISEVLSLKPEEIEQLFSLPSNMLSYKDDNIILLDFKNSSENIS